ncbi:hypothetical protein [Haloplanus natans]|uniref:hypothetical protein n=1 Tax=Haloplanus natans TaxID=376171 RepID=UPI0012F97254|nr:hypothetical protein [Haloplanus natans]
MAVLLCSLATGVAAAQSVRGASGTAVGDCRPASSLGRRPGGSTVDETASS